jgi:hypothetical protein
MDCPIFQLRLPALWTGAPPFSSASMEAGMGIRDEDVFDPKTYAGVGGLLGRLSAMTGQVGNRADPNTTGPSVYAPGTYGSPTGDLISRIRALQQQQAEYQPGQTTPQSRLTDQIVGAESRGNANAANPLSTALGAGQFLRGTWLDLLARHRPDLTGTPDQLAALRTDPRLSAEMVEAYAADNARMLSQAGHEATAGNVYLAHFAGPSGALKVLNADPVASVRSVLGDNVIASNPFLDKMNIGDLRAWAGRKMRTNRPAPVGASTFPGRADPIFGMPASLDGLAARPQSSSPNAPPTASRSMPSAAQGQRPRGLLTNEPMNLWSVQPPIFFPF